MRISDWSSDVCSSDLTDRVEQETVPERPDLPARMTGDPRTPPRVPVEVGEHYAHHGGRQHREQSEGVESVDHIGDYRPVVAGGLQHAGRPPAVLCAVHYR